MANGVPKIGLFFAFAQVATLGHFVFAGQTGCFFIVPGRHTGTFFHFSVLKSVPKRFYAVLGRFYAFFSINLKIVEKTRLARGFACGLGHGRAHGGAVSYAQIDSKAVLRPYEAGFGGLSSTY